MEKHLLAIAVILTTAAGCDNVAWGGVEMELKPPPVSSIPSDTLGQAAESGVDVRVFGPLLLAGEREGRRAAMVVVGEIVDGRVRAFPGPDTPEDTARLAELTAEGSEWILFSEGVRVGRMVADTSGRAEVFCADRAEVSGVVELVPDAAGAQRLLALHAGDAGDHPYEPYQAHDHVYDQRVATISLAAEAIPRHQATWPVNGVLDARDHIQAFQLPGEPRPWIAATFVHEDELGIASPGQGAYSLFVMADAGESDYSEELVWYRSVEDEGKGIPRYFDHLDWDGDGSDEILLDVFGSNRRWFGALDRREGQWVDVFDAPCGSGQTTGN